MTHKSSPGIDLTIEAACEAFRRDYHILRTEIGKAIVGQTAIIDGVLTCLFVGGHALLEGVPGLGKTALIRSLADALHLQFSRIQFTPDLMPADILGTNVIQETPEGRRDFKFMPGPIFSQIVLADEINRATPKTQSALLEAMQEMQVTAGGEIRKLDPPFFVMATQNPLEQEGTYPLPEAQIDRFFFKLIVAYPDRDQLHEILNRTTCQELPRIQPVLDASRILEYQKLIRRVIIAPPVQDYAVRCTLATHPEGAFSIPEVKRYFRVGASPRAAQAIILASKVRALLDGRLHVSVQDIQQVLLPAMRHRVILNFEAEAEGITSDAVLSKIVQNIPAHVQN